MAEVTFYLLEDTENEQQTLMRAACLLAARSFRNSRKITVLCESKQQAEHLDELLWQLPSDSFVPHNLAGEGPNGVAPVEILWQAPSQANRPVLINLAAEMPAFAQRCQIIFDFVPASETLKQVARERYKHYRAAGHTMHTQPASSINENTDG